MNKEVTLEQIEVVESNMRRFKTLVETDLAFVQNHDVALYCCMKARMQLENLEKEIMCAKLNKSKIGSREEKRID